MKVVNRPGEISKHNAVVDVIGQSTPCCADAARKRLPRSFPFNGYKY